MDEDMTPPGQHSHCFKCRKVNCSVFADEVTACVMATCEVCGWRCHQCKMKEHQLTCPEVRVSCVNVGYGCPHMVKRSKMSSHLPVCPASVVHCAEEWSRWPLHSTEKGERAPLPRHKNYIDCGQLDVSLAMRDQRMLIDALKAPRKLRRTLRNNLTQKYPAVPFPYRSSSIDSESARSGDTTTTLSDDESGAPWDHSRAVPGLEGSMMCQLFHMAKGTSGNFLAALEASHAAVNDCPAMSSSHHKSRSLSPEQEQCQQNSNNNSEETLLEKYLSKSDMNKSPSQNFDDIDRNQQDQSIAEDQRQLSSERSMRSSVSSDRLSHMSHSRSRSRSVIRDVGGTQLSRLMGKSANSEHEEEICLNRILGVNINVECINKYMSKPPAMYNFACAQNFRRDQFPWHHRNVHQEIHQGFCGMLEQRCPLAYLGCPFSFLRLTPGQ